MKTPLDPVKAREQFTADLAAMNAGKDPASKPVQKRMLPKSFRLNVGGFVYNTWSAILDEDQSLDDTLDPPFWASQAEQIMAPPHKGVLDIIEVRKPSDSLYAKLLIVETRKGFVRAVKIEQAQLEAPDLPDAGLTTRWNPGKQCHEVIRAKDRVVMASGFQNKQAAAAWIVDHTTAVAA